MKKAIPFFRSRQQKSGRTYYYFEYRSEVGRRTEKPLGADLNGAILAWQTLMRAPASHVPRQPTVAWLLERFRIEQLPLIESAQKQRQTQQELERLHHFFAEGTRYDLTEVSPTLALLYAEGTRHLYQRRRDWSLLLMISKWAHQAGYLQQPLHIPSLGLTDEIKQRERDEMDKLLHEQVTDEESHSLSSKRIFEIARQAAIQKAKGRKRKDLVLALERFKWLDFIKQQA